MHSFFTELKERRIIRAAIGYAAVSWVALQVLALVLPIFHAPQWILQTIVVLIGAGFPAVLVFAWLFDFTGGAIKKTADLGAVSTSRRRLLVITVLATLVAIAAVSTNSAVGALAFI